MFAAGRSFASLTACLVTLGLLGWSARGGQDGSIDFRKARVLRQRMLKGERLTWGADGVKGRKVDGPRWERGGLAGDGTHPSESGQRKMAALLLKFFKTDPTAKGWFLNPTVSKEGS